MRSCSQGVPFLSLEDTAAATARLSGVVSDRLPDCLVIIAREGWGNTDFIEFSRGAMALGVDVRFIGYPASRTVDVTPIIHTPQVGLSPLAFTWEAARICRNILRENPSKVTAIHVRYFKTCSMLPILMGAPAALDFRSGSIRRSATIRYIENKIMRVEALAYDRVTVISRGVGAVLGLRQFRELPLGASRNLLAIPRERVRDPENLRFIYVGTLRQRNIDLFASAFADFVASRGLAWRLDLYGYGSDEEVASLNAVALRCSGVRFLGNLTRTELPVRLAEADIGVSYVPMTPYFNWQPPTKTFEYLMAGLPTLATRTAANAEIVQAGCGWLCDDTADSIMDALACIERLKGKWTVNREAMQNWTWEAIFDKYYLNEILRRQIWIT